MSTRGVARSRSGQIGALLALAILSLSTACGGGSAPTNSGSKASSDSTASSSPAGGGPISTQTVHRGRLVLSVPASATCNEVARDPIFSGRGQELDSLDMTEGADQCTVGIELHGYGNRDLLAKIGLQELCGNGSVLSVEVNASRDA